MNKKVMLLSAAAIGTFALTLTAVLSSNKIGFMTKATESPYAIANDEYEVAFLEQYMSSSSLDSYSYTADIPLGGNNALPGHLYGNGLTYVSDYVGNLNSGVNDNLQWKFTSARVRGKSDPNRAYLQLESSASHNIKDTTAYPESTNPDEYGIGQLFSSSYNHVSAMYTTTPIKNIQDISIFWRTSYTKRAYICFQIDGETTWQRLADIQRTDKGDIKGNYAGTRGWDTYGYLTSKSSSWTTSDLYGKTAKIAIACTEKTDSEEGNFPVSAVVINQNKAAVRYLNTLSYKDNICSSNGENLYFDLTKSSTDLVHNQDLFQLATQNATGEFLAEYNVAGAKTSETTALGLYNHLVGAIPGLGTAK